MIISKPLCWVFSNNSSQFRVTFFFDIPKSKIRSHFPLFSLSKPIEKIFWASICIENSKFEFLVKFCLRKSINMPVKWNSKIDHFFRFPSIKCSSDLRPCHNKHSTPLSPKSFLKFGQTLKRFLGRTAPFQTIGPLPFYSQCPNLAIQKIKALLYFAEKE